MMTPIGCLMCRSCLCHAEECQPASLAMTEAYFLAEKKISFVPFICFIFYRLFSGAASGVDQLTN
jgi:hypothetical protein